jgi:hypothetical protein
LTLDDLANLSEIIGAIAVVVTLVYLSVQVRQNTRAVRTDSYTQATQQLWETANAIAQDRELSHVVYKGTATLEELSQEERFRFQLTVNAFLFGTEFLLRLYENGQIEKDDWDNTFQNNLLWLRQPGMLQLMHTRPGEVSKRLRKLVEEAVLQTESSKG